MTGTKNDRDMTGVLYGGVWEICPGRNIIIATSNHPMRRSRPQEISIFEKVSRHTGDCIGNKPKTLPFRSRMCWKNGIFSVHSCPMTIDKSKFEKMGMYVDYFKSHS